MEVQMQKNINDSENGRVDDEEWDHLMTQLKYLNLKLQSTQ